MRRALGDHAVSITLGIDIGTSGTKTLAIDEKGAILASASAEYPCDHPRPGWSEQDPGPVVAGDQADGSAGNDLGPVSAGRRDRGRSERPDARLGLSRRGRRGDPAGLALERSAHGRRVPRDRDEGRRPRGLDPTRRQPGSDRFHGSEAVVGAQARAGSTGIGCARCSCPRIIFATA